MNATRKLRRWKLDDDDLFTSASTVSKSLNIGKRAWQ